MNTFEGLKVVDFTTNAAGPFATAMLADFGAEVIKIEKPQAGDDMRSFPPAVDGTGVAFFWFNRGKKSIVLDMEDPKGQEVAKKLIAAADIVVESFKPGTMEKFGLGYKDVKEIKPSVIMCSVSAFGQTGPYRHKPGYDIVAQALSGAMDLTGEPDGPPTRSGLVLADYVTGIHAYGAIITALYHRQRTGSGQHIDISLLDCMVSLNGLIEPAGLGRKPTRTGNHHSLLAPFGLFQGTGGSVIIGAPNQKFWKSLCKVMGNEALADDPLCRTGADRIKNLKKLIFEIENWLKKFPNVDEPLALIDQAGIPCAKVNTTNDLLEDIQLQARDMIRELELPDGMSIPKIKARGNPFKFSEATAVMKKPPALGQHLEEVLDGLGYGKAEIAELKTQWNLSGK
ncbi:CaiB/BaiF CoA transferase family protein [Sporomusa aerivorans]|uniref:CaiB/BaiF CoA transferase family protein n=1 Tax=Sporomusa aerivorans TaxID=204936 RepID=UPI00352B3D71